MAYESFREYTKLVDDVSKNLDSTKIAFQKFLDSIDIDFENFEVEYKLKHPTFTQKKLTSARKKGLAMTLGKGIPNEILPYKGIFFKFADGNFTMNDENWQKLTKQHVLMLQQNLC
jgi:hypothetical protein